MPVELRKRVAKAPPPAPEPPKKKAAKAKPAAKAEKEVAAPKKDAAEEKPAAAKPNGASASSSKKVAVGDTVDLTTFGGEILLNDGTSTTLAELATKSTAGVVLFTYPKASTPGCTTQVCLFRDAYDELTAATGFAIYGLSRDSPKANTTFVTKQSLQYPLLCDAKATLISAIGLAKPGGTQRGVFVVDKEGKVLVAESGGPAATLAAVKKLVVAEEEGGAATNGAKDEEKEKKVEEEAEKKAEKVEEKEEKANGGATEEDKEVEKAEAEGI